VTINEFNGIAGFHDGIIQSSEYRENLGRVDLHMRILVIGPIANPKKSLVVSLVLRHVQDKPDVQADFDIFQATWGERQERSTRTLSLVSLEYEKQIEFEYDSEEIEILEERD
jgi:hypothetical protein